MKRFFLFLIIILSFGASSLYSQVTDSQTPRTAEELQAEDYLNYISYAERLCQSGKYFDAANYLFKGPGFSLENNRKSETLWLQAKYYIHYALKTSTLSFEERFFAVDKSISLAKEAVQLNPASSNGWFYLGYGYMIKYQRAPKPETSWLNEAVSCYKKAYQFNSSFLTPVILIVSLYDQERFLLKDQFTLNQVVGMDRKITAHEYCDLDSYLTLASHLIERNLGAVARMEAADKQKVALYNASFSKEEKPFALLMAHESYFGFFNIPPYSQKPFSSLSDKEEAMEILNWVQKALSKDPKRGDYADLQERIIFLSGELAQ